jgi:hypothetical protein
MHALAVGRIGEHRDALQQRCLVVVARDGDVDGAEQHRRFRAVGRINGLRGHLGRGGYLIDRRRTETELDEQRGGRLDDAALEVVTATVTATPQGPSSASGIACTGYICSWLRLRCR